MDKGGAIEDRAEPRALRQPGKFFALGLGLWLASVLGCSQSKDPVGLDEVFAMRRAALEAAGLELQVSSPELVFAARTAAERLAQAGLLATVVEPGGSGNPLLPRIVIGTFSNPQVAELAAGFGTIYQGPSPDRAGSNSSESEAGNPSRFKLPDLGRFRIANHDYRRAEDFLCAVLPDPDRVGLPLVLFAGLDAQALARSAARWVPGWRSGVDVYRAGEFERRLSLSRVEGELRCREIESTVRTLPDRRSELSIWRGPAFVLFVERAASKVAALSDYTRRVEAARAVAEGVLGPLVPEQRATLFVHTSAAAMVRETGQLVPAFDSPVADVVHGLVGEPGVPDDGGAILIGRIARRCLGPCRVAGLEQAVGVWSTGQYLGRPIELAAQDALVFLEQAESDPVSIFSASDDFPQLMVPLRALFVDVLQSVRGAESVRELWIEGTGLLDPELREAFAARLDRLRAARPEVARSLLEPRAATDASPSRDAQASEPGSDWSIGIGGWTGWPQPSERADWVSGERFAEFAEAGGNFLRVTYPVASEQPDDGWFHPEEDVGGNRWFAGLSMLERVALCQRARDLGMQVAFEPRLLDSPSSGQSGWEVLASRDKWNEWFDRLERMLGAQALEAARAGADWFLLPGQVSPALITSRAHVVAAWNSPATNGLAIELAELRLERWQTLIAKLRLVFPGRLSLSLRDQGLLDAVGFWPELDAVGVEFFHPWPSYEDRGQLPSTDILAQSMVRVIREHAEVADEIGKPLFLLAAGYPRTARAAESPWMRGGALDGSAQDKFLAALSIATQRGRARFPNWIGLGLWSLPGKDGAFGRGFGLDADRLRDEFPDLFPGP